MTEQIKQYDRDRELMRRETGTLPVTPGKAADTVKAAGDAAC